MALSHGQWIRLQLTGCRARTEHFKLSPRTVDLSPICVPFLQGTFFLFTSSLNTFRNVIRPICCRVFLSKERFPVLATHLLDHEVRAFPKLVKPSQGATSGGSSSINGSQWTVPQPGDVESWGISGYLYIAIDAYLAKTAKGVLQINAPTITITYTCKSIGLMLPIANWF